MEEDLNECIVITLQNKGEIIPAFYMYSDEARAKIKENFDAKLKEKTD